MSEHVIEQPVTTGTNFLKSSAIVTIGLAFARILGMAFSLVLARLLSPESFGAVQYGISLAGICAILTQPFGQHMFAKLIGSHSNDADEFARVMPQAWTYLLMLFLGSALIALPLLIGLDNLNIGVVAVFVGLTVFYTYYGIARGYLDNPRLLGAYLGSNLVQIIVTVFVYVTLSETSPIPALVIYGTSYFLPLILLQIFRPFPLKISFARPDWQVVRDLNKLAFPIFVAHAGFMIYMAIDLLLLERAVSGEELGVYALAKNLSAVFVLIPMGVSTMILPQIARSPKSEHRRLLKQALVFQLGASAAALVFYAVLYNPVVTFMFGAEYTSSPAIYLVYAAAMIITQTSSIISGALVGSGRGDQQTISVIVGTSLTVIAAFILIPLYAGAGAAAAMLIGAMIGLVIYVFIGLRDFGKMEPFTVHDTEL